MKGQNVERFLSQLYLSLVPVLTIVLALGVGYISYKIYLPIWLLNVMLMLLAMRTLGGSAIRTTDAGSKELIICAVCFVIPTLLTSMFFGLGAPPFESPQLWVSSSTEQRARYYFLLASGLFIGIGFAILGQHVKKAGEDLYSTIGLFAIQIAVPVFFIDMSFWGFYLTQLYQQMVKSNVTKTPEWVYPLRMMFYYVNMFFSALIYLATAAFSLSLKKTGRFKPAACNIYITISLLFLILCLVPPTLPEPFATLNFIVSIPAVPFMFPYFIGINLLRRAGDLKNA